MEELTNIIENIDGITEDYKDIIEKYCHKLVVVSNDNPIVKENFKNLLKSHMKKIVRTQLSNDDRGNTDHGHSIVLNQNNTRSIDLNACAHELTHNISANKIPKTIGNGFYNRGLKLGDYSEISELKTFGYLPEWWQLGKNNYADPNGLLDEMLTEWWANKVSEFRQTQIEEDTNGFFRAMVTDGYRKYSNIPIILEAVYGEEKLINLLTGLNVEFDKRNQVLPLIGYNTMNEFIDSSKVLTENEIKNNISRQYQEPNIMTFLQAKTLELSQTEEIEKQNDVRIDIFNVLARTYEVKLEQILENNPNKNDLDKVFEEINLMNEAVLWNKDESKNEEIEYFSTLKRIKENFISKAQEIAPEENNKYMSVNKTAQEMYDYFKQNIAIDKERNENIDNKTEKVKQGKHGLKNIKTLPISDIYKMSKEEIENLNFHFAKIKDEHSIDIQGLKASQGSNSNGEHRK